jgi:ribosomal protein L40E
MAFAPTINAAYRYLDTPAEQRLLTPAHLDELEAIWHLLGQEEGLITIDLSIEPGNVLVQDVSIPYMQYGDNYVKGNCSHVGESDETIALRRAYTGYYDCTPNELAGHILELRGLVSAAGGRDAILHRMSLIPMPLDLLALEEIDLCTIIDCKPSSFTPAAAAASGNPLLLTKRKRHTNVNMEEMQTKTKKTKKNKREDSKKVCPKCHSKSSNRCLKCKACGYTFLSKSMNKVQFSY